MFFLMVVFGLVKELSVILFLRLVLLFASVLIVGLKGETTYSPS